jgi:hypothetical protein
MGVPYFHPRKTRRITYLEAREKALEKYKKLADAGHEQNLDQLIKEQLRYRIFVSVKWLWFSYCGLGWKTKWSDTDFRHEWDPTFSLVILNRQFAIRFSADHSSHYWESWLYYNYATDRNDSKINRLKQCTKEFPNIWTSTYKDGKKETINFYTLILRKKYLKYINITENNE